MKRKLFFLALALSGGLLGCSTAACQHCDCRSPHSAPTAEIKLKFVKADSEETDGENGYGENAVDGDPNTHWHSEWRDRRPGLPHEIIIELLPPSLINGFGYLPRQDESDHGEIKDYEFYASNDGVNFGSPVKTGAFERGKTEKIETFKPITCRFIKLRAVSEINGLPWTSAAEIRVIQPGEAASAKEYGRGNSGRTPSRIGPPGPNAIDGFVAALSADGGLWLNGIDRTDHLQAESPEEVVSTTLRTARFESGVVTGYQLLEIRKVQIGESGAYTAVLADTNLGQMIVLMQYIENKDSGFWWRRIYSAVPLYHRLY